jgi:hypothetical protein
MWAIEILSKTLPDWETTVNTAQFKMHKRRSAWHMVIEAMAKKA